MMENCSRDYYNELVNQSNSRVKKRKGLTQNVGEDYLLSVSYLTSNSKIVFWPKKSSCNLGVVVVNALSFLSSQYSTLVSFSPFVHTRDPSSTLVIIEYGDR